MTLTRVAPAHEYAKGVQECRGGLYLSRHSPELVEGAKADALPQTGGNKSRPYEGVFTVNAHDHYKGRPRE